MQETWIRSLGREDSLEKGVAFLLGKCQWTEELGGLQSMDLCLGKIFFFFLAWEILWVKELGGL